MRVEEYRRSLVRLPDRRLPSIQHQFGDMGVRDGGKPRRGRVGVQVNGRNIREIGRSPAEGERTF